jgi:NADPH-dependent 7-cyano-7-deazaguanine reductase QueF
MARKPPKGKSLAELNPELVKQWHPTKNGDLTPFDVTCGSNEPVWWKCSKGDDHEWKAPVARVFNGSGCSICSGKKVVKSNCLTTTHPHIAMEWHPTKNGDLIPSDVMSGSNKPAWWQCNKGNDHIWETRISHRKNGSNCPVCANLKVVKSNCLATTHPDLAMEWHPTKNGDLTPSDVHAGSEKKVWWKCEKGGDHEWETSTALRISGTGCPICSGNKVVKSNCLATTHPDLATEWHPTKNGDLTPSDVSIGSNIYVWWKCPHAEDHEFKNTVNNRQDRGCPMCSGYKVVKSNCLATTHPDLAMEWHPTKNGDLTPSDVISGYTKKVWWICLENKNHIWDASVEQRSRLGSACPSCAEYGFNRSKDALFYIRMISLDNGRQALKFGITNNMDGDREKQQIRHVKGSVKTILREKVSGETALDIENLCKKYFGRKGYLTVQEFPDGFSETIKYSEENLNKIKSIVDEVLTKKAEKKK